VSLSDYCRSKVADFDALQASADCVENTLASFTQAIASGCDGLESDCEYLSSFVSDLRILMSET